MVGAVRLDDRVPGNGARTGGRVTLWDDIAAAQAEVDRLKAELDAARAHRDFLLSQSVKGGPDLSQFNGSVDFAQVMAAGYELVFARIADGDVRDTMWTQTRVQAIRDAGLLLSPYYFARVASAGNGERNGRSEAAMAVYFAESQGWGKPGDLPLAYDFETLNGQPAAKAANHVIEFVETYEFIKGHPPIIYTNPGTWTQLAFGAEGLDLIARCPLWIAHWNVASPTVPPPWTSWTFWQYTNQGSLPGATGNVDLNRFSGTRDQLDALRI